MVSLITEISNWVFVVVSLVWVYFLLKAHNYGNIHSSNKHILITLSWMICAVVIRIGWWALALKFAEEGATYHSFFVDYKHIMTLFTALLFSIPVLNFIQFSEGFGNKTKYQILAGVFAVAAMIGLL